jgi:hypothetical protein
LGLTHAKFCLCFSGVSQHRAQTTHQTLPRCLKPKGSKLMISPMFQIMETQALAYTLLSSMLPTPNPASLPSSESLQSACFAPSHLEMEVRLLHLQSWHCTSPGLWASQLTLSSSSSQPEMILLNLHVWSCHRSAQCSSVSSQGLQVEPKLHHLAALLTAPTPDSQPS